MAKSKRASVQDLSFSKHPAYREVYAKLLFSGEEEGVKTSYVKIMPGGEITPHIHDTLEVFFIIEGSGELLLNGEWQRCGAGDCIYAPAGEKHGLKNTGSCELVLLANFPKLKE